MAYIACLKYHILVIKLNLGVFSSIKCRIYTSQFHNALKGDGGIPVLSGGVSVDFIFRLTALASRRYVEYDVSTWNCAYEASNGCTRNIQSCSVPILGEYC
jgi:hypothetical protein